MEPNPEITTPKNHTEGSFLKELLNFALIIIFVVLPIRLFIAQPFVVVGSSMEPTFLNGDYLIIDEISYRLTEPKRGEVVVFDSREVVAQNNAQPNSKYYIKRIIGLPGETVKIENQAVTIINSANPDGFVLDEPYIFEPPAAPLTRVLADDEYFVMGDHRGVSSDSRVWGPLPKEELTGRVFARLFPFSKIDLFPGSYSGDYKNEEN
jgi:signal peptidase I